eukprot:4386769-Amphidinium_carterae.1
MEAEAQAGSGASRDQHYTACDLSGTGRARGTVVRILAASAKVLGRCKWTSPGLLCVALPGIACDSMHEVSNPDTICASGVDELACHDDNTKVVRDSMHEMLSR